MCGNSMRENREIPWSPVPDGGAGRSGPEEWTYRFLSTALADATGPNN